MVKFSHSLFALPFAGVSAILAFLEMDSNLGEILRLSLWISVCLVSARSAAMGFNRYIDSEIDRKNPRTANREIPSGKISATSVLVFVGLSSFIFLFSSYMINPLCFILAFPALFLLFFYSMAKRFTLLCHFILGISIALAPLGAWIAITESLDWIPIYLSLGLFTHIAGFDILYAIQDADFDRKEKLYSIPASLGPGRATFVAGLIHASAILFFFLAGMEASFGCDYYLFLILIVGLVGLEYGIALRYRGRTLPPRFYWINSSIGFFLFFGILFDRWNEITSRISLLGL
jgi:4-hydroxybenzoate polyprenyltransferase